MVIEPGRPRDQAGIGIELPKAWGDSSGSGFRHRGCWMHENTDDALRPASARPTRRLGTTNWIANRWR
jgi:hypothetical protein